MYARRRGLFIVASLCVFAALSLDITLDGPISRLDVSVSRAVAPINSGVPTDIAERLAELGSWQIESLVLIGAACVLAVVSRRLTPVLLSSIALVLLAVLGIGLKELFWRLGPQDVSIDFLTGGAFPSGHAAAAVVVSFLLAHLIGQSRARPQRIALLAIAASWSVAIGWSRVYLNVHWLSDVLAGWALGSMIVCVVLLIHGRINSGETIAS